MSQRISWKPVTAPNIVAFKVLISDTGAVGPFLELATVLNMTSGPNYDTALGVFFYDDIDILYRLYRLRTVDTYGNTYDDTATAPFAPNNDPVEAPVSNVTPLDHNTGGTNALQYVKPNGDPIPDASIRIYTQDAWARRQYSMVVGMTVTLVDGTWKRPIFVEPGNTYVVHYHLPNVFGPDTVEIVV